MNEEFESYPEIIVYREPVCYEEQDILDEEDAANYMGVSRITLQAVLGFYLYNTFPKDTIGFDLIFRPSLSKDSDMPLDPPPFKIRKVESEDGNVTYERVYSVHALKRYMDTNDYIKLVKVHWSFMVEDMEMKGDSLKAIDDIVKINNCEQEVDIFK